MRRLSLLVLLPTIVLNFLPYSDAARVVIGEKCHVCRALGDSLMHGLNLTVNKNFAGGDTAWEERKLGRYATSETRLVEAMETVCKSASMGPLSSYGDVRNLEFKCNAMLEDIEEKVERWYYKQQDEPFILSLCQADLRFCCPVDHFGSECRPCPGIVDGIGGCGRRGECHGNGTREGSGKCKCVEGYTGDKCNQCDSEFYEHKRTDTTLLCEKCDVACSGGCWGADAKSCRACSKGYAMQAGEGCVDVNECETESPCTGANEHCSNTPGSFLCQCDEGFTRPSRDGPCEVDVRADADLPWIRPDRLLRLVSLSGFAVAVPVAVWQRSILLGALTLIALALYVYLDLTLAPMEPPPLMF